MHIAELVTTVDGGNGSKYMDGTPRQGLLVIPPTVDIDHQHIIHRCHSQDDTHVCCYDWFCPLWRSILVDMITSDHACLLVVVPSPIFSPLPLNLASHVNDVIMGVCLLTWCMNQRNKCWALIKCLPWINVGSVGSWREWMPWHSFKEIR